MPWRTVTLTAASWGSTPPSVQTWRASDGQYGAPSTETRLFGVAPLPETSAGDVDFIWRVQSSGFFVVATGNRVQVKSRITDGP